MRGEREIMYTLGIDIGSTSSDVVILRDGCEVISKAVVKLGTGTDGPRLAYEQALQRAWLTRRDIVYTVATGYGRMNWETADQEVSELTCHALGVHHLLPDARTVIDIGGQDAKALRIGPNGEMVNFVMNDKCAAGTGRFLDVMAMILNLRVEDLGAISLCANAPVPISNTCTVFAESEVISKLSAHIPTADIVAGIHKSVAARVAGMALRVGIMDTVCMSGGVALNKGVVAAMENELGHRIDVHPDCQLAGAIGAAVYAWKQYNKKKG